MLLDIGKAIYRYIQSWSRKVSFGCCGIGKRGRRNKQGGLSSNAYSSTSLFAFSKAFHAEYRASGINCSIC